MSDSHSKVQHQFGAVAQKYVDSAVHSSGYSLERMLTLIGDLDGKSAIDIATGGGHVALGLAKKNVAQLVVTDLTPLMLNAALAHISTNIDPDQVIRYAQVDGCAIPFADNSFDLLTVRLAPHHFTDVPRFVKEAVRVVRPGGRVAVVDQIGPRKRKAADYVNAYEQLRDPSHVWEYSEAEWVEFFETTRLKITHREVSHSRLEFNWWTQMQRVSPENAIRLMAMLKQIPEDAARWLQPEYADTGLTYFSLWQLILIGEKS